MKGTTSDYTGRKVDLEIFQTEAEVSAYKQLSFTMIAGNADRKVAGIQKLVQRYLLTFFTPAGSVAFRPDYGSIFMPSVNGGLLQSRSSVVQYFSFADMQTAQQLTKEDQSDEGVGLPDDEKYARSYLIDYVINPGLATLYLKVKLESMAGTDYVFVLPVT